MRIQKKVRIALGLAKATEHEGVQGYSLGCIGSA
jgi:hypothetical protein